MHWALLLLVVYAAWCVAAYLLQDRVMFPRGLVGPVPGSAPAGAVPIVVEAEDGGSRVRVESLLFPGVATRERPVPLLAFFHGNAESVDNCLDLARDWTRRGFAVLLVEYRGYGRSAGTPSERALVADAIACMDAAAAQPGIDGSRIVLHGRSLGAGVAAQVAARLAERPAAGPHAPGASAPAAVIVQSTFTSVPRLASRFLVPSFVIRNTFRTDRALAAAAARVLILHGVDDEIIPVSHGRRLHRSVPKSEYVELPGRHNDFPVDESGYWSAIDAFLSRAVAPPTTNPRGVP